VVVDGNGEHGFGVLLPDDVLIQAGFDLGRFGEPLQRPARTLDGTLLEDAHGVVHADVADVDVRTSDEAIHLAGGASTEGAAELLRMQARILRRGTHSWLSGFWLDALASLSGRRSKTLSMMPYSRASWADM
jgi:hypothetical protein